MIGELVSRLIAAGTPAELAAQVVTEAFAAGACVRQSADNPVDETAEKRRAYDRERQRKIRGVRRQSADNPPMSETALTLKKDNKRVRANKHPCPPDWKPSEQHYARAAELSIPKAAVDAKAEDMRIWAGSTGALKLDWDLTFHGFLRRDAPKLAIRGSPTMATITPASPSWIAWKAHFRDTPGKNFQAGQMDKSASDGKPFTVPSEYPPGYKSEAA